MSRTGWILIAAVAALTLELFMGVAVSRASRETCTCDMVKNHECHQ